MRETSPDVIVLRSVYLSRELDERIRTLAAQDDLDEDDLIADLLERALPACAPTEGEVTVQVVPELPHGPRSEPPTASHGRVEDDHPFFRIAKASA